MTARRAIVWAHLLISVPILALFLLAYSLDRRGIAPASFVAIPLAFVLAWLYWAVVAPRWRLWALAQVVNVQPAELLAKAASSGLLWSDGFWLQRTELRPKDYAKSLAVARLLGALRRLRIEVEAAQREDWGANAFEEVNRHVDPVIEDLRAISSGGGPAARRGALGAQLQVAANAGLMGMSADLERAWSSAQAELESARDL